MLGLVGHGGPKCSRQVQLNINDLVRQGKQNTTYRRTYNGCAYCRLTENQDDIAVTNEGMKCRCAGGQVKQG